MAEPKTNCRDCDRQILQRTADHHDGLCVPCYREQQRIVPPHFTLPDDLAGYLVSVRKDPADYLEMAWQNGTKMVYGYVARELERDDLIQEWSPRLVEFAERCRRANCGPPPDSLSHSDRAKQRIYENKISAITPSGARSHGMTICQLPLIGIPVAQRLWPGRAERVIVITREEKAQWQEMYSHPESAFLWIDE